MFPEWQLPHDVNDPLWQLVSAAKGGNLEAVQQALANGARLNGRHIYFQTFLAPGSGKTGFRGVDAQALQAAAANGHLTVVQYLLDAGAHIHTDKDRPLCWATQNGHAPVVSLLRERGAPLAPIQKKLHTRLPAVQVAALAAGNIDGVTGEALARQGVCCDALCALLTHQGHVALAAMLQATQMLAPLSPKERAELLTEFLAHHSNTGMRHAGP